MRLAILAILTLAGAASGPETPRIAQPSLRDLAGDWRVVSLRTDGASPSWTRRYSVALGDSALLEWFDRTSNDSIVARGFLGRDRRTGNYFYISIAPNSPPTTITGYPSGNNAIEWNVIPAPAAEHPFNRELVSSRLTFSSKDRMDWIGARPAGWHFIFERFQ